MPAEPQRRYPRGVSTHRKIKKSARNWETPTRQHDGTIVYLAHLTEPEYRHNRLRNKRFGLGGDRLDGVAHRLIKHYRDHCKACLPVPNRKPRRGNR